MAGLRGDQRALFFPASKMTEAPSNEGAFLSSETPHVGKPPGVGYLVTVGVLGGELRLSDETTDYGYFSVDSLDDVDVMEHHLERIQDAAKNQTDTILK